MTYLRAVQLALCSPRAWHFSDRLIACGLLPSYHSFHCSSCCCSQDLWAPARLQLLFLAPAPGSEAAKPTGPTKPMQWGGLEGPQLM